MQPKSYIVKQYGGLLAVSTNISLQWVS